MFIFTALELNIKSRFVKQRDFESDFNGLMQVCTRELFNI